MTLSEKEKMEILLDEAIEKARQSKDEFDKMEEFKRLNAQVNAEIEQRKADSHRGYTEGILQALCVFNCRLEEMKTLNELLK